MANRQLPFGLFSLFSKKHVWSSLAPHATLLMPLIGSIESVLVFHGLTGIAQSHL